MHVTAIFDVLSHWCLAAWPALETVRGELGDENVELRLAPILNGFPMGVPAQAERWFYRRGSLAYGATLRPDWYEDERTTTLWANAAVCAASLLGADLAQTAHGVMTAAMQSGELLGRRDVAIDVAARVSKTDRNALAGLIGSAAVGKLLNGANVELARWQCDERPSWRLENANGDWITLKGVWQAETIRSCVRALAADEGAYAQAGPSPF